MFRSGFLALLLFPSLLFSAETQRMSSVDAAVDIKEWPVPWEGTRPRDPYVTPDGKVWFVGQQGDYVAEFNPDGEKLRRFDLEKGAGPHNLIVKSVYADGRNRVDPVCAVTRCRRSVWSLPGFKP